MRSPDSPRVLHDATVELASGERARSVNLSTSGILVAAGEKHEPGEKVQLKVNLRDGANPLDVAAEVVRAGDKDMALRFVELDDIARGRLERLIQKREPTGMGKHDVRIHLPSLNAPLRAMAREHDEKGAMIEADLPWLRLGSAVTAELSAERAVDGHVTWIGLDVTRAGAARLRIFVDFSGDANAMTPPPEDLIQNRNPLPAPSLSVMNRTGAQPAIVDREDASPPMPRTRFVWPAIAIVALIAVGALGLALSLRPPSVALLPTALPEREPLAMKLPPQTTVPKLADATALPGDVSTPWVLPSMFAPPRLVPGATPPSAPIARAAGKTVKKKHARARRRAD